MVPMVSWPMEKWSGMLRWQILVEVETSIFFLISFSYVVISSDLGFWRTNLLEANEFNIRSSYYHIFQKKKSPISWANLIGFSRREHLEEKEEEEGNGGEGDGK